MNDLEEKLFQCYGDSDAWRESAQANYEESCKHREAAEEHREAAEELYAYLSLIILPPDNLLDKYERYSK